MASIGPARRVIEVVPLPEPAEAPAFEPEPMPEPETVPA